MALWSSIHRLSCPSKTSPTSAAWVDGRLGTMWALWAMWRVSPMSSTTLRCLAAGSWLTFPKKGTIPFHPATTEAWKIWTFGIGFWGPAMVFWSKFQERPGKACKSTCWSNLGPQILSKSGQKSILFFCWLTIYVGLSLFEEIIEHQPIPTNSFQEANDCLQVQPSALDELQHHGWKCLSWNWRQQLRNWEVQRDSKQL